MGGFHYLFLNSVGAAPNPDYAATIPQQTYMIYQLMFAIITPALISGAFAERMKFSAMLLFTVLWLFIVYFPLGAHGVGQGRFAECVLGRPDSVLRFCRRHRGPHQFRRIGVGVRALLGQAARLHVGANEAAQPGAGGNRRLPALGGLVRIQRRQRAGRVAPCHQRIRGDTFRDSCGGAGLAAH